MATPSLRAWMKKLSNFVAVGVNGRKIRAFIAAASKTGVGKIFGFCLAAMLPRDYVIDLVGVHVQCLIIRLLARSQCPLACSIMVARNADEMAALIMLNVAARRYSPVL